MRHDGAVLTVRVLPQRGVPLRAAVASLESTGVLVAGHVWAGGMLPSLPWIVLMASAVLGAGLLVLRGRVRPRHAVPALVVTQLLMHAWLTVLAPSAAMDGMPMGGDHGVLDPRMLAVHTAGALLTALLWEVRARVGEVVVSWTSAPPPPVLPPALRPRLLPAPPRLGVRYVVSAAPRRGPPVLVAPA